MEKGESSVIFFFFMFSSSVEKHLPGSLSTQQLSHVGYQSFIFPWFSLHATPGCIHSEVLSHGWVC